MTLHAHVSISARDCDGGHGHDFVAMMNDEERMSQFADLEFKGRILSDHVSFHSEFGVTVKVDEDGFDMHEPTDEGYRAASIRWCEDETCDDTQSSQYDEYAELAGY